MKKSCFANGGKISGPGTATSDSIPAQVESTGENILVSNGERIVSAEQDAVLERIAQMLGFPNIDAMFEALTDKPVGPTIRGGKKKKSAFAMGGLVDGLNPNPDRLLRRAGAAGTDPATPQNLMSKLDTSISTGNAIENSNLTMSEKAALGLGTTSADASALRAKTDAMTTLRGSLANQIAPKDESPWTTGGAADPMNSMLKGFAFGGKPDPENPSPFEKYDVQTFRPSLSATPEQKAGFAEKATEFKQEKGIPVEQPAQVVPQAQKPIPETPMMIPANAAPAAKAESPLIAGTVSGRGKTISLAATPTAAEGYVDANGNPVTKWEQTARYAEQMRVNDSMKRAADLMEHNRLKRDAFDPSITSQSVRDSAREALGYGIKEKQAEGTDLDNQVKGEAVNKSILLRKALESLGAAKPEDREALLDNIYAMQGKDRPNRFTVIPGEESIDPATMQKIRGPSQVLENRTGRLLDFGGKKTAVEPPSGAVQVLRNNPDLAAAFDAKYGKGAAQRYLGAK